jgi:hypothetical protein
MLTLQLEAASSQVASQQVVLLVLSLLLSWGVVAHPCVNPVHACVVCSFENM